MSYNIRTREEYTRSYQNSVEKKTEFWEGIAKEFTWFKPWNTVMNCDMKEASFKWFEGAKTNITFNSIDPCPRAGPWKQQQLPMRLVMTVF